MAQDKRMTIPESPGFPQLYSEITIVVTTRGISVYQGNGSLILDEEQAKQLSALLARFVPLTTYLDDEIPF